MSDEIVQLRMDTINNVHYYYKWIPTVKTYSGVRFAYWKKISRRQYEEIKAQNGLIEATRAKRVATVVKEEEEDDEDEKDLFN